MEEAKPKKGSGEAEPQPAGSADAAVTSGADGGEEMTAGAEMKASESETEKEQQQRLKQAQLEELQRLRVQESMDAISNSVFPITLELPTGRKLALFVCQGDSIAELRHYIGEHPQSRFYTNYTLAIDGMELHDFMGELPPLPEAAADEQSPAQAPKPPAPMPENTAQITPNCTLQLVPKPYSRATAIEHVHAAVAKLGHDQGDKAASERLVGGVRDAILPSSGGEEAHPAPAASGEAAAAPAVLDLSFLKNMMADGRPALEAAVLLSAPAAEDEGEAAAPIRFLGVSEWHPPPQNRMLMGDFFYLDLTTVEGKTHTITASARGFFVNGSSRKGFNPLPNTAFKPCVLLVDLIRAASPAFDEYCAATAEAASVRHPFQVVDPPFPKDCWTRPVEQARRSVLRCAGLGATENRPTYGPEAYIQHLRDWNEDYQSVREMPRTTPQEKIFRDHAMFRLQKDFVDEVVEGVRLILDGALQSINPMDPFRNRMFIRNKIFYCVISDSELYRDIGGEETAHITASNDLKGISAFENVDVEGIYTVATCVVDYMGYRFTAQAIVPGILQVQRAQVVYGAPEPNGEINFDEDFHALMCKVAERVLIREHKIKRKDGSVINFAGPSDMKGIVGTDNRKYVLDLSHPFPRDPRYTEENHYAYLLRPELIANYYRKQEIEMSLAQKAQTAAAEAEAKVPESAEEGGEEEKTGAEEVAGAGSNSEKAESGAATSEEEAGRGGKEESNGSGVNAAVTKAAEVPSKIDLRFNPDLLLKVDLADDEEELARDRALVQNLSDFLVGEMIPGMVSDWRQNPALLQSAVVLRETMRQRGINMRYLGLVVERCREQKLQYCTTMCVREIFVRSAKHVFRKYLQATHEQLRDGRHSLGASCSRFLNCIFGTRNWKTNGKKSGAVATPKDPAGSTTEESDAQGQAKRGKKRKKGKNGTSQNNEPFAKARSRGCKCYSCVSTHNSLWNDICARSNSHFQFELTLEDKAATQGLASLRSLCLAMGVQIASRGYDLTETSPFQPEDIVGLFPKIKQVEPQSGDAVELLETSRIYLDQGRLDPALELLSDALHVVHHIYGPLHQQTASCYALLAALMHFAGKEDRALVHQRLSLIIRERVLGFDHDETIHGYASLGMFHMNKRELDLAARFFQRALQLARIAHGGPSPAEVNLFLNIGLISQDLKAPEVSRVALEHAKTMAEVLDGENSLLQLEVLRALSNVHVQQADWDKAVEYQSRCVEVHQANLGDADHRTKQSVAWLERLKSGIAARKAKDAALAEAAAQAGVAGVPAGGADGQKHVLTEEQLVELLRLVNAQQQAGNKPGQGAAGEQAQKQAGPAARGNAAKQAAGSGRPSQVGKQPTPPGAGNKKKADATSSSAAPVANGAPERDIDHIVAEIESAGAKPAKKKRRNKKRAGVNKK